MNPTKTPLLAAVAFVAMAAVAAAQSPGDTIFVKTASATVRDSGAANAKAIAELKQGDSMQVISVQGPRIEVRLTDGRRGFIPKFNTTPDKPKTVAEAGKAGFLRDDRGAGEQRSAAGIRGLNPVSKKVAAQKGYSEAAVRSANRMEATAASISNADIEAFMKEGGVTAP